MNSRIAPRTPARSSTTRSQGLAVLVITAEHYYGSSTKTIRKWIFFRSETVDAATCGALEAAVAYLVGAESKLVDDSCFVVSQFSRPTVFYGDNIPPGTVRHGAFGRFKEILVFMQAAAEVPTIIPGRFIVPPSRWQFGFWSPGPGEEAHHSDLRGKNALV